MQQLPDIHEVLNILTARWGGYFSRKHSASSHLGE